MLKKMLVLSFISLFLISCGGSNLSSVCSSSADALFDNCDNTDPTDVATIVQAYDDIGDTVTAAEVMAATESSFKEECETDFEDADITGDQVQIFEAGLEGVETACALVPANCCKATIDYIFASAATLFF